MNGSLTLELFQQIVDDFELSSHTDAPEMVIVSHTAYQAMETMPGGPSMANYVEYLKKGFGVE